jgi:hypothetical protein
MGFLKAVGVLSLSLNSAMGGIQVEISQSVSDAERVLLHKTILACVNPSDR